MNIKKYHISLLCLLVVATTLPLLISPKIAKASSGDQLYLSPSSQSVTNGSNLVVSIVINTGGDSINTVQTVFTYSASDYSLVSIVPGSSFGSFPNTPSVGSIQFSAATTGSVTGTQTAATVTLHATNIGTSSMSLASVCPPGDYALTCSAAYDSSTSNNDLSSVGGGSYTVTLPCRLEPCTHPTHNEF